MSELAKKLIEKEKKKRTGRPTLEIVDQTEWPDLMELTWLQTLILSSLWFDFEFDFYDKSPRILLVLQTKAAKTNSKFSALLLCLIA